MGTALKVAGFIWNNRGAIMRLYHTHTHHKVALDALVDMAEEHPKHPANIKKRRERQMQEKKWKETYDAGE